MVCEFLFEYYQKKFVLTICMTCIERVFFSPESCSCLPESIRGTLSQMMDFSLLKNPIFLLIGVANLFGMLGFYTPFVYLPSAAIEKVPSFSKHRVVA